MDCFFQGMDSRSTVIAAALIGLLNQQQSTHVAAYSARQSGTNDSVPIYRVTVVGRSISAINYRRSGDTKVDLVGTALLPGAHGTAEVSAKSGHTEIDARVRGMQRATRFGSEYLTYVLWAITPEGRPRNLGEVQFVGETIRKQVTTELQAFALVVTAEPYFAVTQPSDVVVMENAVRADTAGKIETVQARYELLPRGAYVMNRPSDFSNKPLGPDVPLDLAEARNAIELARMAGASRYAADTLTKAARLLAEAETAREQRRRTDDVITAARQSVQTAEDARLIAVKRQQEEADAQKTAQIAEGERHVRDERQRADREAQAATQAKADAARERLDVERTRDELQQARLQALKAQAAFAVAEQERKELRERLRAQLDMFLETRETARGLIMNVPDVLFYSGSARLTADAREKLARVSGILAAQADLHITVEGHTDNVGNVESNQRLSEQRSHAVLAFLIEQKIPTTAVDTAGFGEARPVASNDTPEGRQQNRRVEIIVRGESIGVSETSDSPQ
jgi:outer membrane protein OmpA-like peptidoglycan-associated protein